MLAFPFTVHHITCTLPYPHYSMYIKIRKEKRDITTVPPSELPKLFSSRVCQYLGVSSIPYAETLARNLGHYASAHEFSTPLSTHRLLHPQRVSLQSGNHHLVNRQYRIRFEATARSGAELGSTR
jgi:hypothetical protein